MELPPAAVVQRLRAHERYKPPGVAEAIDWAGALQVREVPVLDEAAAERTLAAVVKHDEDLDRVRRSLAELVADG